VNLKICKSGGIQDYILSTLLYKKLKNNGIIKNKQKINEITRLNTNHILTKFYTFTKLIELCEIKKYT